VIVEADERGATMTQPRPEFEQVDTEAADVLAALRLSSADAIYRSTAGGITHVLVATSEPIDRLDLDLGQIAEVSRACRGLTLVPFRKVDDATLQARVFAPAAGVPEDSRLRLSRCLRPPAPQPAAGVPCRARRSGDHRDPRNDSQGLVVTGWRPGGRRTLMR